MTNFPLYILIHRNCLWNNQICFLIHINCRSSLLSDITRTSHVQYLVFTVCHDCHPVHLVQCSIPSTPPSQGASDSRRIDLLRYCVKLFPKHIIQSVTHSLSHQALTLPPSLVAASSLAVPIPLLKTPKAFFTVLVALLTGSCPLWLHCVASATSVAKCFIPLLLPLLKHYLCTSFILKASFSLSFLLWLSARISPHPLPCSLTVCAPSWWPHALPFLCILISHTLKSWN